MRTWVSIEEARERLDDLLEEIEQGEEPTIMKDGQPVGRLSALSPPVAVLAAIDRLRARLAGPHKATQEEIRDWRDEGLQ